MIDWLHAERRSEAAKREAVLQACDIIDRIYQADVAMLDAGAPMFFSPAEALDLTDQEYARENFHDRQTNAEFEHRRRLFSNDGPDMRTFFTTNASQ